MKSSNKKERKKVPGENDFGPFGNQVLDGGNSSSNSSIVGDVLSIVQRDIQISAQMSGTLQNCSSLKMS